MRSVALSEVPCGAAMTIPGRPFSTWTDPAIGPAGPAGAAGGASAESLPAISPAQPWTTRASPSATLAAPRLVIGAVPDQHGLRHRVLAVVGEGEEHPRAALGEGDLARAAGEHHGGGLAALAPYLELAPLHPHAKARAEGLEVASFAAKRAAKCGIGSRRRRQ